MMIDLKDIPCFGIAGNFTGHLEQAGEDKNFVHIVTKDKQAPKLIFPTYISNSSSICPKYLKEFPFSDNKILYPKYETKLQSEPECGIIFSVEWNAGNVTSIEPMFFASSNDCSIRKENSKKISEKKNWGPCSKGFSSNWIKIDSFDDGEILDSYNIASFLIRNNEIFDYGEDSQIKNYSYFHKTLLNWIIEKINTQDDTDPGENIKSYLESSGYPSKIMISIGATRYTEFGEKNFMDKNDEIVIAIYPESKFTHNEIKQKVNKNDFSNKEISFLVQKVL